MNARILRIAVAALVIGAVVGLMVIALDLAGQKGKRPTIGSPAPDFSLASHTGATLTLASFRARRTVVTFLPFAFTGG